MKDTLYYNEESEKYSRKRYPPQSSTHTHYLFKRRLFLLLDFLSRVPSSRAVLEVGCADGVVISEMARILPDATFVGVDISQGMIDAAKKNFPDQRFKFLIRRDSEIPPESFGFAVEVGVLNLVDIEIDLAFLDRILLEGGHAICSISASSSLLTRLRPATRSDYRHLLTYREYERMFLERFEIIHSVPYGVFVPYLWKIPIVARKLQSILDLVFTKIAPSLCHEKIYLLRRRTAVSK